jgi:hypothetical protein
MAVSHQESQPLHERRRWSLRDLMPEVWASLAISVIWLAVLFDAVFGPDIVISNSSGYSRIPSAIVVVVFAYLATRVVARYGFGRQNSQRCDSPK